MKVILSNAEKILTRAEVWQSHNRKDLSKAKRYFGDSKRFLDANGYIFDVDASAEGIAFALQLRDFVLPRFEKFSVMLVKVSEDRCKKILNNCILTQVKK